VTFASRETSIVGNRPTLFVEYQPSNRAPTLASDIATTRAGVPISFNVLSNDSDPDGDMLRLVSVGPATHGSTSFTAEGQVTYTPAAGYIGADSFSYTVTDGVNLASSTVSVAVNAPVVDAHWPDKVFAPYVDATAWPLFDFVGLAQNESVRFFNLAFIVANGQNQPKWGGYDSYDLSFRREEIRALRELGGDVMVSFGGAAGTELAVAITDVSALSAAYQSVIDAYSLTHIDFDIEGAWVAHPPSIDRRSQAIRNLQNTAQANGKALEVWFTLPVLPTGLTPDGLGVIASALAHGVEIAGVNVMAMDYGDSAAPAPEGRMGAYAIQAGQSLHSQLRALYAEHGEFPSDADLWSMVGITPMIGQNDVPSERFYQADARELLTFAESHALGLLSFWSANRDNGAGPIGGVGPNSSGITQGTFEFTRILDDYTGSSAPSFLISDAEIVEGDSGTQHLRFQVRLSAPLATPARVRFSTLDGTASAGTDYTAATGLLEFAPGETSKTVEISIRGDLVVESDEQFFVRLLNPEGAALRDGEGVGIIRDDDTPPAITIGDATVLEGNSETTSLAFTVTLSRAPGVGQTVRVSYASANGTAMAGSDYATISGEVQFQAGETTKLVVLTVFGDTAPEADETMRVLLSSPVGGTLVDDQGIGTIRDDDTPVAQVGFAVSSRWDTGFIGQITLTNTTSQTWADWRLEFDFPFEIASIWSAEIVSHVGNRYVIRPADWTRRITPGARITFGFEAIGSNPSPPSNVALFPVNE
jgi:chitinase